MTAFIIQSGLNPVIFFPAALITLMLTVAIGMAVSGVVAGGLYVYGEVKKEDEKEGKVGKRRRQRIRERKRKVLMRFCVANLVRTFMIIQYPLTVCSGYWLSHFASSSFAPLPVTLLASLVLALLCVFLPSFLLAPILTLPLDRLHSAAYIETLGPLYDHLRRDRTSFSAIHLLYIALQGFIVGLYPKTSPRVLVNTFGTPQFIAGLVQPLLLVIVELGFVAAFWRLDPYVDRFSGRVQWAVCAARLMVLTAVCTFGAAEYRGTVGERATVDTIKANEVGMLGR
ncbi:hypothetical protein BC829DRAFT_26202 [Chytridium lagenaria]|nr:hypothetical protein BC829DRAFT_26202 [Chytridium lagenaria]